MHKSLSVAVAVALAAYAALPAGYGSTEVRAAPVRASPPSARRSNRPARRPPRATDGDFTTDGGLTGCFDPRLSGRPRAVAESLGGRPCATGNTNANGRSGMLGGQPASLVGAWVGRGQECGGEGLVLQADGRFLDQSGEGLWSAEGETLYLMTTREQVEGGELGETSPVRQPRPVPFRILARTARSFSVRSPSGNILSFTRCR